MWKVDAYFLKCFVSSKIDWWSLWNSISWISCDIFFQKYIIPFYESEFFNFFSYLLYEDAHWYFLKFERFDIKNSWIKNESASCFQVKTKLKTFNFMKLSVSAFLEYIRNWCKFGRRCPYFHIYLISKLVRFTRWFVYLYKAERFSPHSFPTTLKNFYNNEHFSQDYERKWFWRI